LVDLMKLRHPFGYDCEEIDSLISDNTLDSFLRKVVALGKKQDPDFYDPLKFMGDAFEWFIEYFFKVLDKDHTLTYTSDYQPNFDYDRGIDGRGICTLDGLPNVIQAKFKANPNIWLTNEDNISNVMADACANEGLNYNGKNVIIITSCKGVHPKHAMANVHCINRDQIARRVDNNIPFWNTLRTIVSEQNAK
tara:strand:- start:449 stop:1027 length:579 start_codon:yes stop_codon:yes gene_type:complete